MSINPRLVSKDLALQHPRFRCFDFRSAFRFSSGGDGHLLVPKGEDFTEVHYFFGELMAATPIQAALAGESGIIYLQEVISRLKATDLPPVRSEWRGMPPYVYTALSKYVRDGILKMLRRHPDPNKFTKHDIISPGPCYDEARVLRVSPCHHLPVKFLS